MKNFFKSRTIIGIMTMVAASLASAFGLDEPAVRALVQGEISPQQAELLAVQVIGAALAVSGRLRAKDRLVFRLSKSGEF